MVVNAYAKSGVDDDSDKDKGKCEEEHCGIGLRGRVGNVVGREGWGGGSVGGEAYRVGRLEKGRRGDLNGRGL